MSNTLKTPVVAAHIPVHRGMSQEHLKAVGEERKINLLQQCTGVETCCLGSFAN